MNALILPKNFIAVLAALVLAALLGALPRANAFAAETETEHTGTVESIIFLETEQSLPRDPDGLRRLLAAPHLSATERQRLERALEETYEELA